jgi:hypothetical protein
VLIKYPGRSPKLSKWRGAFLVLSHEGNAYALQDLVSMDNLSFDISILKHFDPSSHSPAKVAEIARVDTSEGVIDSIVSYTRNLAKKNSLEFRVHWKDSEPDEDAYHRHHQISIALYTPILLGVDGVGISQPGNRYC